MSALPTPDLPPDLLHDRPFDIDDDSPEATEVRRTWRIRSVGEAEWAMGHLVDAERKLAELRAQRDAWMTKIGLWFDQAAASATRSANFFGAHLEHFMEQVRTDDMKTLQLPSGRVSSRAASPKVDVADDDALIAWVEAADWLTDDEKAALVKVEKRVLVSELRRLVSIQPQENGEPLVIRVGPDGDIEKVPGVEVTPGSVTYTVHPNV